MHRSDSESTTTIVNTDSESTTGANVPNLRRRVRFDVRGTRLHKRSRLVITCDWSPRLLVCHNFDYIRCPNVYTSDPESTTTEPISTEPSTSNVDNDYANLWLANGNERHAKLPHSGSVCLSVGYLRDSSGLTKSPQGRGA